MPYAKQKNNLLKVYYVLILTFFYFIMYVLDFEIVSNKS